LQFGKLGTTEQGIRLDLTPPANMARNPPALLGNAESLVSSIPE
jgi:hypothetical protein